MLFPVHGRLHALSSGLLLRGFSVLPQRHPFPLVTPKYVYPAHVLAQAAGVWLLDVVCGPERAMFEPPLLVHCR